MLPFAFYLLKVTICSGILFGYYWFMLRNKIFNQYNRFYLMAAVVLSIALPLIEINIWHHADQSSQSIKLLQVVNNSEYLDEMVVMAKQTDFTAEQAMFVFYSITSLIFLGHFLQALIRIRGLFIKHRHSLVENIYFVNTTAQGTPFSFLKYIFWNDHIDPESPAGHQIFKHELAHVQQKHTYDKLFLNTVLIFLWCNPFFWLMRKELNIIHEFMADKIAVEDSDTEAFAAMILQASYPQHQFNLSNPFFYSPIKRRLMMLTKNRNTSVGYFGRLMALPLMVIVFAAFTLKAKTFKETNSGYNGKKITVVIDAGHGGSDNGAKSIFENITEKDLTLAITRKIQALNTNTSINIILTRETDITQSVQEKAAFTKLHQPDLFISMHIGATPTETKNKSGMNVWVAKDDYVNAAGSKLFASAIIDEFNRNYKLPVSNLPQQGAVGIKVLQESVCPSVLIEAGYITNQKDLAYLQTEEAKESIAKNILAAIDRYAFSKEKPVGISSVTTNTITTNNITTNSITTKNAIVRGGLKRDTLPQISLKNEDKALIIVDGKTISNEEMKKINPEDIESVSVFKDDAALAKYGEKGKNGVVIIQTKMKVLEFSATEVTVFGDTSTEHITLSGNVKLRRNSLQDRATQPLYVIDGNIQTGKINLDSIDPDEVESISVFKGNNALKKYGEAAKNGAIEITTKSKKKLQLIPITANPGNIKLEAKQILLNL